MLRSFLPLDYIIARAKQFYVEQESERGSLLDATAPIGMIVHDLLAALGIPENAIGIVMGMIDHKMLGVGEVEDDNAMMCCFDDGNEARYLFQFKNGPRAVCRDHAYSLSKDGYKPIHAYSLELKNHSQQRLFSTDQVYRFVSGH